MVNARPTLLTALTLAACGLDLPEEALLDGPRVLAVRVVPQGTDELRPLAALSPGTVASTETLIVDDLGPLDPASMSALWVACPLGVGLPAFSCLEGTLPLERAEIPACPESADSSEPLPAPCILSTALEPEFTVPGFEQASSGARLELTLVLALQPHDGVNTCADALFRGDYDTPDGCFYASYPLTLSGPADDTANRHPGPGRITVAVGDSDATEFLSGATLTVPRGDNVVLTYAPTPDDTESYEISVNNGASFEELLEDPSVRWFRDGGDFLANGPFALSYQVVLDLPSERTRVYAVLRDGRGGVGWWWADLVAR